MKNSMLKKMCYLVIFVVIMLPIPVLAQNHVEVLPDAWDFGDVGIGSSSTTTFTFTNVNGADAMISSIEIEDDISGSFSVISDVPPPPIIVGIGESQDIDVEFSPSSPGEYHANLHVVSDAADGDVTIPIWGVGVSETKPPSELIADLIEFFDESVEDGTLEGRGRGWLANLRLCLMREMLVITRELIEYDRINAACFILQRAYMRCDGDPLPLSDFVAGDATEGLAQMITELMDTLGCR